MVRSSKKRKRAATGSREEQPKKGNSANSAKKSGDEKKHSSVKISENKLFAFDSKALTQLARGTSVVIATLLSLADAIALIPNAPSVVSWAIKLIGVWITASVLWFVGFLGLTNLLRIISRGVNVTDKGVKLSRFDRLIPFDKIKAVTIEPNYFFTRLFSLTEPALRITILFDFGIKGAFFRKILFPNFIPSFFFSRETFLSLGTEILARAGLSTDDLAAQEALPAALNSKAGGITYFRPDDYRTVSSTYKFLSRQRVVVTCIVAFSLVAFLAKKAFVNFSYNSGNRAYRESRFEAARDYYLWAVKVDPTFAVAWNSLGQTEFRLSERRLTDFGAAERCWRTAILCKLDYVEPRLNLVRLCFYRRKFNEAADLLEHASKLAPDEPLTLVDQAELNLRRGKVDAALPYARSAIAKDRLSGDYKMAGSCLAALAYLIKGENEEARAQMKDYSQPPLSYQSGNITMLLFTRAMIASRSGDNAAAEEYIRMAVRRQPANADVLLGAAYIMSVCGKPADAKFFLDGAAKQKIPNPWAGIIAARLDLASGDKEAAFHNLCNSVALDDDCQDAFALRTAADMLAQLQGELGETESKQASRYIEETRRRAVRLAS